MAQYQSFPDTRGDSRTLDKLKALRLPVMKGRRFLDIGCNEGFFCGFARFAGASRSVGVDNSRTYIERAQFRFPDCEFHCTGWDHLPDGPFDVILLASALHYADDQPALIHKLVDHLSPDGVLVLELGIVSSRKSEWVEVTRGIDVRWFPSMMKLREILAPYASKWIGPSVNQEGDPVARHVVHVSKRRPVAYLLMQAPGFGKSSLARSLFEPAGIKLVSGDLQLSRVARDEIDAPASLRKVVKKGFSPYRMDRTVENVFKSRQGKQLVDSWLAEAGEGDFVVDAYIPEAYRADVCRCLMDAGYMTVTLDWERPGPVLLGGPTLDHLAQDFGRAVQKRGAPPFSPDTESQGSGGVQGYVDQLKVEQGELVIGGWARTATGQLPSVLTVRLKGRIVTCDHFEAVDRPDVLEHLGLDQGKLGFRIRLDVEGMTKASDLGKEFSVAPLGGRAFKMTPAVTKVLDHD